MSGWMARGRAQRAAALGLALRVLLSFGLGLEAAPTSIPTWSLTQAPGECAPCSPGALQACSLAPPLPASSASPLAAPHARPGHSPLHVALGDPGP